MKRGTFIVAGLVLVGACKKPTIVEERTDASAGLVKASLDNRAQPTVVSGSEVTDAGVARAKAGTDPRAEKFCKDFHGAAAARRSACCGSPKSGAEEVECTTRVSEAMNRGAIELIASVADACIAAQRAALNGCDWVTPGNPPAPAACGQLVRGLVAVDAPCRSSLECVGAAHCDSGRCRPPEAEGASCGAGVDALAAALGQYSVELEHPTCALHCNGVSHKCEATPVPGTKCFTTAGCAAGQLCSKGVCRSASPSAVGESCATLPCRDGLLCRKNVCRDRAKAGEVCESDLDCAIGGCRATDAGVRTCGMTCSHAGDLDAIKRKLGSH